MFEQLFRFPGSLTAHLDAPLLKERRRFLRHRAEQGICHSSLRVIAYYLLAGTRYLRLGDRPKELINIKEVEKQARRWARRSPEAPNLQRMKGRRSSFGEFLRHTSMWLKFMERLEIPEGPTGPFDDQLASFEEFLLREKGLSPFTVSGRCRNVWHLLNRLAEKNSVGLREITISQIDEAFVELITSGRYSRATVQGRACDLRSFFSYAETKGWCSIGLASSIKGPTVYSQETIPAGPSWVDVQRLVTQAASDRPTDIRDRAILMFLAFYGLRGGEVRRLRLEDLDWEHEVVTVTRGKTLTAQRYPLARQVGDAVLRYLKEVRRPRSPHREVFLTVRPPFRPLESRALTAIAKRRLEALGTPLPHYGSHSLRHACATHLLAQGFSLKQIGDHLGHRHPDSTRIYAKVDLASLRQVADFDMGGLL